MRKTKRPHLSQASGADAHLLAVLPPSIATVDQAGVPQVANIAGIQTQYPDLAPMRPSRDSVVRAILESTSAVPLQPPLPSEASSVCSEPEENLSTGLFYDVDDLTPMKL